ncbi:MAG: arylamine N-acetyltransferase [Amphiplicatus sp.]
MKLETYFKRIGYAGPFRPDLETLAAVMRAHLFAIPFENLDVQLARPISLEPERIFDKLVERRRGGWCYEQNGLLGMALREIGFDVTRLAGGVMRDQRGDVALGNHLCLLVKLNRPYLVDVGFGGSLLAPIPFETADHDQAPFKLRLFEMGDGYWRFEERADGEPFSYDVAAAPADESLLAKTCVFLQTNPSSPFVQNLVAQKRDGERHLTLRGRVLKDLGADGATKRLIETPDQLVSVLAGRFGIDLPEAASLWPAIVERHEKLFGGDA